MLYVVIVILVWGVFLYLVQRAPFVDAQAKTLVRIVVTLVLVLWMCQVFGLWDALRHFGPERVRLH